MSIRLIAKDLYRLIREVEELEKQLAAAPMEHHERLREQIRQVKAERDRVHAMLEGSKSSS